MPAPLTPPQWGRGAGINPPFVGTSSHSPIQGGREANVTFRVRLWYSIHAMSYQNPGMTTAPRPMLATPRFGKRTIKTLIIVGVIVIALFAAAFFAILRFQRIMNGPLSPLARMNALKDLPKFPTASYDDMATRSQLPTEQGFAASFGAKKVDSLGYSTVISPAQVIAWYDREMPNAGYQPDTATDLSKIFREVQTRQYRKGSEVVLLQVQNRTQMERDTVILVFRFSGVE